MDRKILTVLIAGVTLAGCGGGWMPWSSSSGEVGVPRTPPGAKGYACEGGKRLLVRFEADAKSAWVIYPDREFRLDRIVSASGERFSNGSTTLATQDGEARLEESGAVQFAKCKLEQAP
jgi:membrane-bound inhibitor of C-type lysozyme